MSSLKKQEKIERKGVCLNPLSNIHYIDHLAVISIIMGTPIIFLEPNDYEIGTHYYPQINPLLVDFHELSPEYLIASYDVLFFSDLWDKVTFHEKYKQLEMKYGKTLRHVHCPHGFSDKGFYLKKCANEDIALIYGQNMLDLLKHEGVLNKLTNYVISGNYRYTYFKQHRQFFDEIIKTEVLPRFVKQQPIILYAPTWLDMLQSTTFFECFEDVLGNLPDSYNMIIKLHPHLELDDAGLYYKIMGQFEKKPNVLFLKDFPLVYPLLALADIYLGDTSSVGYDFLSFNKPMFFLNKRRANPMSERDLYLFRCGVDVKPEAFPLLYQLIENNLQNDQERFGKIRAEVYEYTFGPERPFADIKADIIAAYNKPLDLTHARP